MKLNINKAVKQKSNARKAQFIVDQLNIHRTVQQESNARIRHSLSLILNIHNTVQKESNARKAQIMIQMMISSIYIYVVG